MSAKSLPVVGTDLPAGSPTSEINIIGRWMERLEDQGRRFPQESILISFLLGGLLQVVAIRALLLSFLRLVLWLATPILFGFAAWRLYRSVAETGKLRQSSYSTKTKDSPTDS
jgi:hypothetical protein